jgi:hypothetical protein
MESRLDELLRTYAFAPLGELAEHKANSSTLSPQVS